MTTLTTIPFFFFNDTATTEIYTLSLHDALPIYRPFATVLPGPGYQSPAPVDRQIAAFLARLPTLSGPTEAEVAAVAKRSEEHTSELQSHLNLVCRLLLAKQTTPSPHTPALQTRA